MTEGTFYFWLVMNATNSLLHVRNFDCVISLKWILKFIVNAVTFMTRLTLLNSTCFSTVV